MHDYFHINTCSNLWCLLLRWYHAHRPSKFVHKILIEFESSTISEVIKLDHLRQRLTGLRIEQIIDCVVGNITGWRDSHYASLKFFNWSVKMSYTVYKTWSFQMVYSKTYFENISLSHLATYMSLLEYQNKYEINIRLIT